MRRTLLVTNDFPPRVGGIQSYVHELCRRLPADQLVVYAPAWEGAAEFDVEQPFRVVRHPTSLMLPVPSVARRAARLVTDHRLTAAWFGAAAPLALLAPTLRRHGVQRTVASTHGHEVGWAMLPGSRQLLRRIGATNDVITFVSKYSRSRIASALGPSAALDYLPPGVDPEVFRPDPAARALIRERHGLGDRPVVVCVSRLVARKGQDTLVRAWPTVLEAVPGAVLLLVGDGPAADEIDGLIQRRGLARAVVRTGRMPWADVPRYHAAADVFAMPCRTRGRGLDVEGLGIVFLEASATGVPVIAGASGGAPEAVLPGRTGEVVDGRDPAAVAQRCIDLLLDRLRAAEFGATGREWVRARWSWDASADRLARLLSASSR